MLAIDRQKDRRVVVCTGSEELGYSHYVILGVESVRRKSKNKKAGVESLYETFKQRQKAVY